jgi:predicted nucleotidyltransferase
MKPGIHTKNELLILLSQNRDMIKSFGVKKLGLFGSFASETNIKNDSDVDFLVDFETGKKSFDNFMGLSFFLHELINRKIELVTPQSLSKYIGPHILKQLENVSL